MLSNAIDSVRIEGGADAYKISGAGNLNETTILGGSAADSLTLTGTATGGYFDGAAGHDSLVFAGFQGSSTGKATVLGGAGTDYIESTADLSYVSLTGGAGADSISTDTAGDDALTSTILGGDGNDTIDFMGGVTSSRIKGEVGNDTIRIDEEVVTSTVTGGAGNDSIDFGAGSGVTNGGLTTSSKFVGGAGNDTFGFGSGAVKASDSTYYFGSGDGDDKLYFASNFTGSNSGTAMTGALTIAVDSALGATSSFNFSGSAGASASTITFDTSGAGSIFVSGASLAVAGGNGTGFTNITFVTVSSSTITDLG